MSSTDNGYKYPQDIVDALKPEWQEWHRYEADIPPLPADDHLRRLFEIAYHASFTVDEHRRTRVRLVVCDESQASRPLRFASSRLLSPHEIMRLAPAASATDAMLGVEIVDGQPRIWGLCESAFMQLLISIRAPGTVHVGRNHHVFVALEGGRFSDAYSRPGVFQAVIDSLGTANALLWKDIDWPGGAWSPHITVYPNQLYDALMKIRDAGHGGTVLMVPEDDLGSRPWERFVHVKYGSDENSIWPQLMTMVAQYDSKVLGDEEQNARSQAAETEVRELTARMAGLAAVDGAVLITDHLRILGFGAEVIAPAGVSMIQLGDGAMREVTAYGTRHRSAFRFCAAYPSGTAFICSQDGGIKCVRNRDDCIVMWE